MDSDSGLPQPSCTNAARPIIPNVFDVIDKPCFVGRRLFSIELSGLFVPLWVRPDAVVIGSHPQQHLGLFRGDRLIVELVIVKCS